MLGAIVTRKKSELSGVILDFEPLNKVRVCWRSKGSKGHTYTKIKPESLVFITKPQFQVWGYTELKNGAGISFWVMSFMTEEDAIALANSTAAPQTSYGMACALPY